MQGQQPVLRQTDQQQLLQATNIVIKMNEVIQPITPVGKYFILIGDCFHVHTECGELFPFEMPKSLTRACCSQTGNFHRIKKKTMLLLSNCVSHMDIFRQLNMKSWSNCRAYSTVWFIRNEYDFITETPINTKKHRLRFKRTMEIFQNSDSANGAGEMVRREGECGGYILMD